MACASFEQSSLHVQAMGDKTDARKLAEECGVPVVPGSEGAVLSAADAAVFAGQAGYPVILKAAYGGGGRGMRVVRAGTLIHCRFTVHCFFCMRVVQGRRASLLLLLLRCCALFGHCHSPVRCSGQARAFAASGSYSPGAVPAPNQMNRWLSKHPLGVKAALVRFGIAWFGTQMYG